MPQILHACTGGALCLPDTLLCDRQDGGHLIVNPPRPVWERHELAPPKLALWSLLVAATGRAMLETLPCLSDGCINYWEAGNWALNDAAEPAGPKKVHEHRRVHLHLFGRSRQARHPDWRWGESPRFPVYRDVKTWTAAMAPLDAAECAAVAQRVGELLAGEMRLAP